MLGLLTILLLAVSAPLEAENLSPWRRLSLADGTVECVLGGLPVVIAAPHGGRLDPPGIPDRRFGVLATDAETDALALELAHALDRLTGRFPQLVICHLKRSKVDCNRDAFSGAGSNPRAHATWIAFHRAIGLGRSVSKKGIFVDLHGHSHPDPRVELGYRLSADQLAAAGEELRALEPVSTLARLSRTSPSAFEERLRGATSLGGFLEVRGYPSLPAPSKPHPDGAPYFQGGYNVERYRAKPDDPEDGWISVQVECPRPGVRDSAMNRRRFAEALADSIVRFLAVHADLHLREPATVFPDGPSRAGSE